jgi:diguanylate cyclase (GGDEF)-like protein
MLSDRRKLPENYPIMTLKTWPKPFLYFKDARLFLISISAVVMVFVAAIFLFRYLTVNDLLLQSMKQSAESFARLIVLTRHWNAQYGGVYVEKKKGVESNPFLMDLGIDPDIRTVDGRVLTLRNPALMTREISDLALQENIVGFRLVSLRTLNPVNRPDDFERTSLERFEQGDSESWKLDRAGPVTAFRYVLPLKVEEPCLRCHRQQGYRVGDIRGGISVILPAERLVGQMSTNRNQIIADSLATTGVLLAILYFLTWKLVRRVDEVQKKLKHIAVTDELTGLKNRRYIMEQIDKEYQRAARTGGTLSLILLDIDHFKRINDTYGHAVGDAVLKEVAQAMQSSLRAYDLLGRVGGEEFLIASPGSTLDDAAGLAERVRVTIKDREVMNMADPISVTVSAGITSLSEQDATTEALLARADNALYLAKQQGRDRVVSL